MAQTRPDDWEKRFGELTRMARGEVSSAASLDALEGARVSLLGRKGTLTLLLKGLKDLPMEDRKRLGPEANKLKSALASLIEERRMALESAQEEAALQCAGIDLSLPPAPLPRGGLHPITQTIREVADVLGRMGFSLADGPLVEDEYHNFEALNIPADHSARDEQDTFYLAGEGAARGELLMRTHTSPVQIRRMEGHAPPVRIIAPGRVFRHEAVDASHSAVFYQIEGLYVDRKVTMADLRATLDVFLRKLFGAKTKTRFRPSYFPFTEPSAEVDMSCLLCGGSGCSACKQSGWMEMLGCGLVNPAVLRGVGYDPEAWSGFAFGVGVERIAMLRWGIPDIRMFYENDIRFLEQFS